MPQGAAIPPRDLEARLAAARAGDELVVADGVYRNLRLALRGHGTAERPILIRSATPGGVRFQGRSALELRGEGLVLSGFRFEECTETPLTLRESRSCRITQSAVLRCNAPVRLHWIRIAGASSRDNRVDHCFTDGKLTDGVVLTVEGADGAMPQGTRIDHNHFRGVVRAVRNGMETLRIGTSDFGQRDAATVVEENLFEACSGDAEIISVKSCANLVRYNTLRGCEGAVTLRHGHRNKVYGNFFFGEGKPRSAGIRIHGSDHQVFANYLESLGQFGIALPDGDRTFAPAGHEPTLRALVAHNTVVETAGPGVRLGGDTEPGRNTPPTLCRLVNNIITGARPWVGEGVDAHRAGNLLFGSGGARSGTALLDPRWRRRDLLWRPTAPLPAAAPCACSIDADIDGQPWPTPACAGADQASDAPSRRTPLSARDVGPAWMPR